MIRLRAFLASSLLLAVAAACADAPKVPVHKNLARAESSKGTKGAADDAARHAACSGPRA